MKSKGNLVVWGDSALCPSGFGNVTHGLMKYWIQDWEIRHPAINFSLQNDSNRPEYFKDLHHFDIKGKNDLYGRANLIHWLKDNTFSPDIIFLLQDSFILSSKGQEKTGQEITFVEGLRIVADKHDARIVTYFPIDAQPYIDWVKPVIKESDKAVTYTQWAIDEIKKVYEYNDESTYDLRDLQAIPHGADPDQFSPYSKERKKELKKSLFGVGDETFVIGYVGANQRRKNIPREVFMPFVKFHKKHPNSMLRLKTAWNNPNDGYDLEKIRKKFIRKYGLKEESIKFINSKENPYLPLDMIEKFYNAIDLLYLPSMEGWGLPVTEAMACKTLTMVADHASLQEVGGEGRSIKVTVPDHFNHQIILNLDNNVTRKLIDIDDAVEKFEYAMNLKEEERDEMINQSYEWISSLSWESVAKEWDKLFTSLIY